MRRYYVYIMASRTRVLYVGTTSNLVHRVVQHKDGLKGGFTARYHVNRLVYFEAHGDGRSAIDREKEIKGWRREKKVALIKGANPTWADLARDWSASPSLRVVIPPPASQEE